MNALRIHVREDGTLRVLGKGAKEREVALSEHTLSLIHYYMAMRQDTFPFLFVSDDGEQLAHTGIKSRFL